MSRLWHLLRHPACQFPGCSDSAGKRRSAEAVLRNFRGELLALCPEHYGRVYETIERGRRENSALMINQENRTRLRQD